jgi:hypothetical protein
LDQVHIGVRIRKPVITYYLESPVRPAVLDWQNTFKNIFLLQLLVAV